MIVAELIQIQKKRKLTNNQMAKSLNIHEVSWFRIKRCGTIGPETLIRAIWVYPELKEIFLRSLNKDKSYNNAEKPQDKRGSPFRHLSSFVLAKKVRDCVAKIRRRE